MVTEQEAFQAVHQFTDGLEAVADTPFQSRVVVYVGEVIDKYNLQMADENILIAVQEDLDFISKVNGHEKRVNGATFRLTGSKPYYYIVLISKESFTVRGWESVKLTIRHELAHVESWIHFSDGTDDGEPLFKAMCHYLDAPVTWKDHTEMLM